MAMSYFEVMDTPALSLLLFLSPHLFLLSQGVIKGICCSVVAMFYARLFYVFGVLVLLFKETKRVGWKWSLSKKKEKVFYASGLS